MEEQGEGSSSRKDVFYHYTTPAAADQILQSRLIKKSTSYGDAAYGPGVYLTKMPPKAGQLKVALNNWDGMTRLAESLVDQGT